MKIYESALLRERYFRTTHKSGLTVCVFPKKMTVAHAVLAVRFGSLDTAFRVDGETEDTLIPDGTAHYLEHKLFDGPDGIDAFARFSAIGADANAYTDYIRTAYLFNTSEHFEEALTELLRFVTTPYFTAATVRKERGIITEEIRSYRDSPYDRCLQNLLLGLYREHPVRRDVCGSVRSIRSITPDLLYRCYRAFYRPSNMILCVCGDVAPEDVLRVVDLVFPERPESPAVIRRTVREPEEPARQTVRARRNIAKPFFYLATKDPCIPADPDEKMRRDAAMSVLSEVLFSQSSPFFGKLFEEGLLTANYSQGYSIVDSFAFHSICGESDAPGTVRKRFLAYLEKVRRDGIREEDLVLARRSLIADQIRAYDSTEEICSNLLSFTLDGADLFTYPELLAQVTREDCERLLHTVFRPDRVCLSVVSPKAAGKKESGTPKPPKKGTEPENV